MKFSFHALIVCALATLMTACGGPSLQDQVDAMNKTLPQTARGLGRIQEATLDGNTITLNVTVLNRTFNLKALEQHPEALKAAMMPFLSGIIKTNKLGETLVDADGSLAIHFETKGPKKADVTVTFTPEDIQNILDDKVADDPMTKLQTQVAVTQAQCPIRVDSDTQMTGIKIAGGNVVYEYEVNEKDDPEIIKNLNDNKAELTKSIKDTMRKGGRDIRAIVDLTKEAGCGMEYLYKGVPSGQTCSIVFPNSEL